MGEAILLVRVRAETYESVGDLVRASDEALVKTLGTCM